MGRHHWCVWTLFFYSKLVFMVCREIRTIARPVAPLGRSCTVTGAHALTIFGASTHPWMPRIFLRVRRGGSVRLVTSRKYKKFHIRLFFYANCDVAQNPYPKPPPSFLSPLITSIQNAPPMEFQLPEDIRTYFKNGSVVFFSRAGVLAQSLY
jgi:hypothetical protein